MNSNPSLQSRFTYEYLKALDCPRALSVWLLFSSGEHEQLLDLKFDPLAYNSVRKAADSLAATSFLSKATFLSTNIDKKKVALEKFFEAEELCRRTNSSLRDLRNKSPEVSDVLSYMRQKISRILGSYTADELVDACDWGPGASVSIPRRRATPHNKYSIESSITASAYDFIKSWHSLAYPLWDVRWCVHDGNKVVTVPKNAKTDRVIAIEPGFNLWYQKGIGSMLRRRLCRVGVDLSEQRHNQRLSRLGSKYNQLATVDFSSASDTISYVLVEEILPSRWFHLMNSFRSARGQVNGIPLNYQKFSSMGNGYTFELETLIFYTLALYCCKVVGVSGSSVSVYGDDVILPIEAYNVYSKFARILGFEVNSKKSYADTYYRESCGSHYWNGVDIKPIFLKQELYDAEEILRTANAVRLLAHRRNSYGCDRRLRRAWLVLSKPLGRKTPRVPYGYGDVGLIVNYDELDKPPKRASHGLEGFMVPFHVASPYAYQADGIGLLLYKLKSIGRPMDEAEGNELPLPGRVRNLRKKVLVPRWDDLGPWI